MKKSLKGLFSRMSLRNNYLSLVIATVLFSLSAHAQYDSTKTRQLIAGYGTETKNPRALFSQVIPTDTPRLAVKDSGGIAFKGGRFWLFNGRNWIQTSAGTITITGSGDSITFRNNTLCIWRLGVDSCYPLNQFVNHSAPNYSNTCVIHYNVFNEVIDSVCMAYTVGQAGPGLIITHRGNGLRDTATFIVTGDVTNGFLYKATVTYDTLLKFIVRTDPYISNGIYHLGVTGTITLPPADATFGTFYTIGVDTSGNIIYKAGTPSASPEIPTMDGSFELPITSVLVPAGATELVDLTKYIIYDKNTEPPTKSGTATVNYSNTTKVYKVPVSADVSSSSTTKWIIFTMPAPIEAGAFNMFGMFIKPKAPLPSTAGVQIIFFDGATQLPSSTTLGPSHGFNKSDTNYQNTNVPYSGRITRIQIVFYGAFPGAYLDVLTLQGGIAQGSSNFITATRRKPGTDTVQAQINGLWVFQYKDSVGTGGGGSGSGKVYAGSGLQNLNDSTLRLADSVRSGIYTGLAGKYNSLTRIADGVGSGFGQDSAYVIHDPNGRGDTMHFLALTPPNSIKYYLNGYRKYVALNVDSILNAVSLTGTQTLTNKTLTSPIFNASSTVGYVWTATNTSGSGAWATPPGGLSGSGVATRVAYWNGSGSITSDTTFRYSPTGALISTQRFAGLVVRPTVAATANADTIVALDLSPVMPLGAFTGVVKQTIKIWNAFLNVDSLYNFSFGTGTAAKPSSGNSIFMGNLAGTLAASAANSNFLGNSAGYNAVNASSSNFVGTQSGYTATNASNSNFYGTQAGYQATGANNSNFFGNASGTNASSATLANFFGPSAGSGATSATGSNFFGNSAGINATGANNSNFLGQFAGQTASSASFSNFLGYGAGSTATSATFSNFMGYGAGQTATSANNSNFFGQTAGYGATGANNSIFMGNSAGFFATGATYSIFMGYHTGDSLTYKVTGANNILLGTNITTPAAASTNTLSIGNVLYGINLYGTVAGNPSNTPQATGAIGVNVATPTSTLQSGGSFSAAYVAKTATYTATVSDYTIECTANTFTVTLPTAVGITGRIYNIVNSGAGTITIATTSSQTFVNVTATPTTLPMATLGAVTVQSNGANWIQLK